MTEANQSENNLSDIGAATTTPTQLTQEGNVAVITLQHKPYNLLGPTLLDAIQNDLRAIEQSQARAVLIRSSLRHFSAGADLDLFKDAEATGELPSPVPFLELMENFPLPIVASVNGICIGGGFELALCCDYVVAGRSAKIGSVEVTLGIAPLMGAIQRQVQRAGAARAKEISMLGHRYDAETMERWNLINRVVDDEHLQDVAMAVAQEFAQGPTVAYKAIKTIANVAAKQSMGEADATMMDNLKPLWTSGDVRVGLESLFKNGPGLAKFKGE